MFQRTNTTWLSFCNHIKISYLEWQFLTGSLFIKRWLELQKKQKTRSSYVCTIFSILWQKETCTPFDIQNKNKKNRNFLSLYGENCVFCWHMWTKTKYRLNNELNQISHKEKKTLELSSTNHWMFLARTVSNQQVKKHTEHHGRRWRWWRTRIFKKGVLLSTLNCTGVVAPRTKGSVAIRKRKSLPLMARLYLLYTTHP